MALVEKRLGRRYPETGAVRAEDFDFDLSDDTLTELVIKGYKFTQKTVKGKKIPWVQKFDEKGKVVEEYPLIDKTIDLYITGFYKDRKTKEVKLEVQIRVQVEVSYIPKKEVMEGLRKQIEERGKKILEEWAAKNEGMPAIEDIKVEMRDGV